MSEFGVSTREWGAPSQTEEHIYAISLRVIGGIQEVWQGDTRVGKRFSPASLRVTLCCHVEGTGGWTALAEQSQLGIPLAVAFSFHQQVEKKRGLHEH